MDPQERAFWDALDADATDEATRLVFADWLDERGRHGLANAFRFAAEMGFSPRRFLWKGSASRVRLKWGRRSHYSKRSPWLLPDVIFDKLGYAANHSVTYFYDAYSCWEQFALALALALDGGYCPQKYSRRQKKC